MRRLRCPKCDYYITFDETQYESGQTLVFECPACHKQFKIRLQPRKRMPERLVCGMITVVENSFHYRQDLPLYEGDNTVGRYVKGTNITTPIETVDPSVDTLHCIIRVHRKKNGAWQFDVKDANSNTGTFCGMDLLAPGEWRVLEDDSIITIGATTLILKAGSEKSLHGHEG